jgi:phage repressor protein C with HTH and peptisase S24 domain
MTKQTWQERVRARMHEKKITQAGLGEAIGRTQGAVGHYLNGRREPSLDEFKAIAGALDVSLGYLLDGPENLGPAMAPSMRPVHVIDNIDEAEHEVIEVPRYTLRASAGTGEPVFEVDLQGQPNYCRAAWARREQLNPENLFSMVVVGDSMLPYLPDGAKIIVHRQQEIRNGEIYVICRAGECYVKRLYKQIDGSLLIRSDNHAVYGELKIRPEEEDQFHIVGLVVDSSFNPSKLPPPP